jgi:hypothetical protein
MESYVFLRAAVYGVLVNATGIHATTTLGITLGAVWRIQAHAKRVGRRWVKIIAPRAPEGPDAVGGLAAQIGQAAYAHCDELLQTCVNPGTRFDSPPPFGLHSASQSSVVASAGMKLHEMGFPPIKHEQHWRTGQVSRGGHSGQRFFLHFFFASLLERPLTRATVPAMMPARARRRPEPNPLILVVRSIDLLHALAAREPAS